MTRRPASNSQLISCSYRLQNRPAVMAPLCCRYSLVTVIVASVGVLSITQTEAVLQCYQCHSAEQPECNTLRDNHTALLKPCLTHDPRFQGQQPFCRKIYQTIHRRNGLEVVVRRCGWVKDETRECYRVRNMDHAQTVCQCFSDGCNSAHTLSSDTMSLLLTLGLLAISLN